MIAYNYDSATTDITQRLKVKWKSATIGPVFAAPAIGDINQDGILDVVTTAKYDRPGGSWTIGSSLEDGMYLYAMNGNDGTPLTNFPVHMCETTGRSFPTRTSAIIADIAGDSKPEILFSFVRSIGVVKADGTYYSAINVYGTDPCQPFNTRPAGETSQVYGSLDASNGTIFSTPAVDDIDSDGDNEVIAIGIYNQDAGGKQGDVLVWTGQKKGNAPWPMFRGNISRTGALARAPHLSVSPTEITLLHQIGQTDLVPFAFTLSNVGGGILDWRYTGPTDITPSTISGSLSAQTTLSATINSTSLSKGIHTRTITVDATNGTAQAQGSPVTVTLTIKVVDEVFQVHLPVAVR